MHTLIAYSTKHGATKVCAESIAKCLPGTSDLKDLDASLEVDLAPYDAVIIGTSVYMSKPRKPAKQFAKRNEAALLEKKLGLFLCCIQDIDKNVREQFSVAYPKALLDHAVAMEQLGGVVDFTKLKSFDKMIMNMVAGDLRKKTGGDVISTLSDERIRSFCKMFA